MLKKDVNMKKAISVLITYIFLSTITFAQNAEMENLYKACWFTLMLDATLVDNNNEDEILVQIDDSREYKKAFKLKNKGKLNLDIPFGAVYNVRFSSPNYLTKWIILNLKDSLSIEDLNMLSKKKLKYSKMDELEDSEANVKLEGSSYIFVINFELVRKPTLPDELERKNKFDKAAATIIFNKKTKRFDYDEKYTKAYIQKLTDYYKQGEVLMNNPELLSEFHSMSDSIKSKEFMLTSEREKLLKERLLLLEKQSQNEALEKEKLIKDIQLSQQKAIAISKQKQLDLANQLRINQEQKAKELLLLQQIEREQFLTQKKLNESALNQQKALAQSKQKELELANQEKKTKQLEIENATYTKNAFLGLTLFIAIVSLLLLRAYFIKRNSNAKLHKQNELIAEQKQEITDSIQYAQRIQFAILPTKENILKAFPQSFILFKPKDIVSGDFYWFQDIDGKKYIAACDCTGHGVPGALMSMVATDMLNDALVHTKKVDEILAHTNRSIRVALKQSTNDDSTRDGMDIALCCFNDKTNVVQFAGAYRPLWLIRSSQLEQIEAFKNKYELIEYKATKAAIGGLTEDNQVFQINEIQLQKGDTIYLSSDGYADQFSPNDKKLMTKRFKEILLSIQHLSMPEQGNYLEKFITDWRGNMEQTDDVLVIGVRV
jgi:serine phosphatase RsbU (regulator of sigma subunit)